MITAVKSAALYPASLWGAICPRALMSPRIGALSLDRAQGSMDQSGWADHGLTVTPSLQYPLHVLRRKSLL